MPFRRRKRFRRRRRPRRRRRARKRLSIDPERKFIDNSFSTEISIDAPQIVHINPAIQGVGDNQRLGYQALTLSSVISVILRSQSAAPNVSWKMWLIHDRLPSGVVMTLPDFLSAVTFPTVSPRNLRTVKRFKVLWAKRKTMTLANTAMMFTISRSHRILTKYVNVGGTIGSTESGALMFVAVSDELAAGNPPLMTVSFRVRFTG